MIFWLKNKIFEIETKNLKCGWTKIYEISTNIFKIANKIIDISNEIIDIST